MAKAPDTTAPTLFHILPSALPTGLARLAAEAEPAGAGHEIEFKSLETRSILNKSLSKRQLSLAWSINPYRGCEFACRYCYARYTHEFLEPAGATEPSVSNAEHQPQSWATAFERRIFLKQHAAWLLEQDLHKVPHGEEIALGTATDPYQPIERKAGITRSLLEVFARRQGHRIGIITKSNLILRDIDLLTRIAARNTLVLHLTITTTDTDLARLLEPRAPRPDLRFQAVTKLREAGLTAGILCSPLLPGITDNAEALDRMATRAAYARASFFAASPLFLKQCSRPTYLSFVREHFPHLLSRYEQHFRTTDFAPQPYRERMATLVRAACRRHHLPERSTDALLTRDIGRKPPASVHQPSQQRLFA
ncbi:DNA repair photolyase [Granulicella pectinivorans]|uniref:DNA repair photolyase n=1 Tax=Granulicella pectinivorans TaxID=474950 RepID=A0A1I6MZQ2_9BACT|nr:radical SAM protein [Granulicella pectinivorans]SFS21182.1 DNA repair photolyase [Granulicella pectinivorans]